jgi:two-component system, LytTR family, response regulator
MMRAMIVDDELHAREELEAILVETGEFEIVARSGNVIDALRDIRQHTPDVLFLDIQMPAVSGFELLSMIDEETMPRVIFVTAYDEYAVKAFEKDAVDYLIKPVQKERLTRTIRKLKENLVPRTQPALVSPQLKNIPCVMTNRIKLISLSEVDFVRSDLAGVYVVTAKGEFFTELTLRVLETKTPLFRCHKQFLVNLEGIDEILLEDNAVAAIKLKSGANVPVSRRFLKKLKEQVGV